MGLALVWASLVAVGCTHKVKIEPIEIKPIHATLDVNIRIDRELDDFFGFEKQGDAESKSSTQPQGDGAGSKQDETKGTP